MNTVDFALTNAFYKWTAKSNVHIIYAGLNYATQYLESQFLEECFIDIMPVFGLKSLMFTMIAMTRIKVVTKEIMKAYYKGKFHDKNSDQMSVNDDLELIYEHIKSGRTL